MHIDEHIIQKRAVYERYKKGLKDLPVRMNPFEEKSVPNYWMSCMLIDEAVMCQQVRSEKEYLYKSETGKSCPQEILDVFNAFNIEGRPIWKPMHMQPLYRRNDFVVRDGNGRARSNAYSEGCGVDIGGDIFSRGVCLPSDNKMTVEEQNTVIEIIHRCFR